MYAANQKAWMSRAIFSEWLRDFDREMEKQGRHVCLLLDNCSAHHVDLHLTNVELRFFPPNCTLLIRPLDQGIIRSVKCAYRARVVDRLLLDIRFGRESKVDAIQAVEMLAASWSATKREVITNCFRKAGFERTDEAEDTPCADVEEAEPSVLEDTSDALAVLQRWEELREQGGVPDDVALEDFLNADSTAVCTEELSEADIVAGLRQDTHEDSESDTEEDICVPSVREVLDSIDVLRRYAALNKDQEGALAALASYERSVTPTFFKTVQKGVTDYFCAK
ncbi:tigger transposable element-derived protein 6-like [Ornithodoros turicata]|uniref:tigger transposable element-derived protein 6-like n=1 Tax=Ornithodoros turicata TaxID=34597 RepID=UPI0031393ACD